MEAMATDGSIKTEAPNCLLGACCLSLVFAGGFAANHKPIPLTAGIDFLYCPIAIILTLIALTFALFSLRRLSDRELVLAGFLIIFCAAMLYYMFGFPVEQLEQLTLKERHERLTTGQITQISLFGNVIQNLVSFGIAAIGGNVKAHGLIQINSRRGP